MRARRLTHPKQRQERERHQQRATQQGRTVSRGAIGVNANVLLIRRGLSADQAAGKAANVDRPKLVLNSAVRSRSPEFSIITARR